MRASCASGAPAPTPAAAALIGGASRDGSLLWALSRLDKKRYELGITYRLGTDWKRESAIVG